MLKKVIDGSNGGRYCIAVKLLIGPVRELPGRAYVIDTSTGTAWRRQVAEKMVWSSSCGPPVGAGRKSRHGGV